MDCINKSEVLHLPRDTFNSELESLHHDIIRMGTRVGEQITDSMTSLLNHDSDLADTVIRNDDIVDNMETSIEEKCVKLIARQQPLAIDLRRIFASIKFATDLERIADYAVDIARITIRLKGEEYIKPLIDIPSMARIVREMINSSIDAYINRDIEMAEKVCLMDDKVDAHYKQVFNDLLELMKKDPSTINQGAQFLLLSKFLERAGDHVTNICEWTVYLVTGEYKEMND
jgi:phosphate transport system protein